MIFYKQVAYRFFSFITLFGLPVFYIPIIVYVATIDFLFSISLILILLLTELVCGIIKITYTKNRPTPLKKQTLFQKYYAGSFPSIHCARIIALFIGINMLFISNLFIFVTLLIVIAVGYSRIYLKKHDVIDVLGGYAIGAIIAMLVV